MFWTIVIIIVVIMIAYWAASIIIGLGMVAIIGIITGISTGVQWIYNKLKGNK
jgi:hypothetical protein